MTRETRIGLLVGLMFIILFGLVLSDLTGSASPPRPVAPAPLPDPLAYAWTPTRSVTPPGDFAGQTGLLNVPGPTGVDSAALSATSDASGSPSQVRASLSLPAGEGGGVVLSRMIQPAPADATGGRIPAGIVTPVMPAGPEGTSSTVPPAPRPRTYRVKANDSLIKIARAVYGSGGERHYKLIFQANRDKLSNEGKLRVGQELTIPPLAGSSDRPSPRESVPSASPGAKPALSGRPAVAGAQEMDLRQLQEHLQTRASQPVPPRRQYVVQRGDTLTKIAGRVLNDDSRSAVQKLIDANRDKLANPNKLSVGVKLVVPS